MKIAIVGTGGVGKACAMAVIMRGCARELVLLDKNRELAQAVAVDMQYGALLSPNITVRAGEYEDLAGADLVMITAGVNEKTGGATDRKDPVGRLKLLKTNVGIFSDIIPAVVKAAPDALLLIVSDPPDPLADITRQLAGHDRVISAGTFLDSLRFRYHIARHFKINPMDVNAQVIGEHGTSAVFLWSSVSIGGKPLSGFISEGLQEFKEQVESDVKFANITIIEGNDASQYGIGMVCARIAEMVLRDEQDVITVGSWHAEYGVTFSMPSVLGRQGVSQVITPAMSLEEEQSLEAAAGILKKALQF